MTTMVALERRQLTTGSAEQRDAWLNMLRTACNTVRYQSPALITATTVSALFEGLMAIQRHDLLTAAEVIAAENGLQVELEDTGTHLVARFSRPVQLRVVTPGAGDGVADVRNEEGAGNPQPTGSFLGNRLWHLFIRLPRCRPN